MGTEPSRIRRAAAAHVGGLPRAFWLIFAGTLINRLGTFVEPFTMLYLTGPRGLSTSSAGLAVAAIGAGGLVSQLVGGWLADRIGRVPTLAFGMLASAIALAGLGLARGIATIVIAAAAVGLVGGIYRPASQALIADIVEPADRTRAYGLQYWALNAGFSGAALLAGTVVAAGGFGLFFVLDAATCLAFGAIVLVGIREPRHAREASRAAAGGDGGWGVPLHDPLLLFLCGLTLASGVIYFQGYTTLPLAMRDDGLGAGAYGTAIAVNGIAIILIQPLVLLRVQSLDRGLVLASSSLLVGIGFGATALADSLVGYMLTVLVWTVGEILATAVTPALVASLAPAHLRGRYMGLFGTAFAGSFVFAPSLGTAIYSNLGGTALWVGCALLGGVLALGFLALERAGEGRVADSPAAA